MEEINAFQALPAQKREGVPSKVFGSLEKVINYQLHRSTVTDFFDSVFAEAKERNIDFDRYEGDLWQYNLGSKENAYWTGYFTSQSAMK